MAQSNDREPEGSEPQRTQRTQRTAAIHGRCALILTFNTRHFHHSALAPWAIQASHPQEYLSVLYETEPKQVIACLGEIAGHRRLEIQDVLIRLGKVLPSFATRVLDDLG